MENLEIISLIYKSTEYLKFITDQLKSDNCKVEGWDVGVRIVANNATKKVVDELLKSNISYSIYHDPRPDDYYLNRVYRAYNFAIKTSTYKNVCLVNSDMAFSKGWLSNLLKHYDGKTIPCSRLIESGKMPSGQHGISLGEAHVGRSPNKVNLPEFDTLVEILKEDRIEPGGLFMPCIFEKSTVLSAGLYPEGNIYKDGIGTTNGYPIRTGDEYFFNEVLGKKYGMKHITVFDSLVYHIQEGEKDE